MTIRPVHTAGIRTLKPVISRGFISGSTLKGPRRGMGEGTGGFMDKEEGHGGGVGERGRRDIL